MALIRKSRNEQQEQTAFVDDKKCACAGCRLDGTIANSVNGSDKWFCAYHDFAAKYGIQAMEEVTRRIDDRIALMRHLTTIRDHVSSKLEKTPNDWPGSENGKYKNQWAKHQLAIMRKEITRDLDVYQTNNSKASDIPNYQISSMLALIDKMKINTTETV